MTNFPTYSSNQAELSWVQSCEGEWFYFLEKETLNESTSTAIEQDYIWLVSHQNSTQQLNGNRIANKTIESFVEKIVGVNQVVVFGVPHELKGNDVQIYVEISLSDTDQEALSKAINEKLADYFGELVRAETIKFVDEMPSTANKSLARKILKSQSIKMKFAA